MPPTRVALACVLGSAYATLQFVQADGVVLKDEAIWIPSPRSVVAVILASARVSLIIASCCDISLYSLF